jgi:ribosomal protein S18 acetylase RimI-like enzyme
MSSTLELELDHAGPRPIRRQRGAVLCCAEKHVTAAGIRVRSFCREDEDVICALWAETWHAAYDALSGHAKVAESIERFRAKSVASIYLGNPTSRMLVAEVLGQIAGTITCSERDHRGVIHGLYVRPPLQRRGIGSLLLRSLLNSLRDCDEVSLKALKAHSHAIAFYRRHGFIAVRKIVVPLWGVDHDAFEMRLTRSDDCQREGGSSSS